MAVSLGKKGNTGYFHSITEATGASVSQREQLELTMMLQHPYLGFKSSDYGHICRPR